MAGNAARLAAESERAQRDGGPAFHSFNGPRENKCHFSMKLKDNRKYKENLLTSVRRVNVQHAEKDYYLQ